MMSTVKRVLALLEKYNPYRDPETGRFVPGGGAMAPDAGGTSGSTREERAKRTHKSSTKEKQDRGEAEQERLSKQLGRAAKNNGDNKAFDVVVRGKHAIEVKTVMDNDNDKITVHKSSRLRKEKRARENKWKSHMVAIDVRGGKRKYYYKKGVGSYRLSAMEKVSVAQMKDIFSGKSIEEVMEKYNPYRDSETGQFVFGGGGEEVGGTNIATLDNNEGGEYHYGEWEADWKGGVSPEEFVEARDKSKKSVFLSHQTPEELHGCDLILSSDGKVGAAVTPDGDLINVFNNGGPKGAGTEAILEAIDRGAITLDCFDDFLPTYYHQYGFEETGRMDFNKEYAPEGWSYEKYGEPDVVFMGLKSRGDRDDTRERVLGGKTNWQGQKRSTQRYRSEDWDQAKDDSRGVGAFSISGKRQGVRSSLSTDRVLSRSSERHGGVVTLYELIVKELFFLLSEKYNPYRDPETGRFVPGGGGDDSIGIGSRGDSKKPFDASEWEAMGMGERRDAWESKPVAERDRLANAASTVPQRQAEHMEGMPNRPNTGYLKADLQTRVNQFSDRVHPEAMNKIGVMVEEYANTLEVAGGDSEAIRELTMEAVESVSTQEMEACTRQLGDHGAAHITGNIGISNQILNEVPGAGSDMDKAIAQTAMIFHDAGYLAPPSQMFMDEGHPRWSNDHYDANVRGMVDDALGRKAGSEVSNIIRTHDSTDMDWSNDPVASASRTADNLSVFSNEKSPPILRYVDGNEALLREHATGKVSTEEMKTAMKANIDDSDFPPRVKELLHRGVEEVGGFTAKFSLGMKGGVLDDVKWNGEGLDVSVRHSSEYDVLNELGDFGQRQFTKLAKTYGADPDHFRETHNYTFKNKEGVAVLRLIEREAAKLIWSYWRKEITLEELKVKLAKIL